jgi:hypothetical protein
MCYKRVALHQNHSSVTSVYSVTAVIMGQMMTENDWVFGHCLLYFNRLNIFPRLTVSEVIIAIGN